MRLRYAGTCRSCGEALAAGETAVYERDSRTVVCLDCAGAPGSGAVQEGPPAGLAASNARGIAASPDPDTVRSGSAGASAHREYERRRARREERVRAAHPKIGGFLLAISEEPQSTRAWAAGARGEVVLGKLLDSLARRGVRILHDRRIPRTKANIDHIAVGSASVFVVDAKRYKGRPRLRVDGGLLRPRVERLIVGSRDQTKLVAGVHKQVELVRAALVEAGLTNVPVRGALCFVDADWPLLGGSFVIDGVSVVWPKKLADLLVADGPLDGVAMDLAHRTLDAAFPPA